MAWVCLASPLVAQRPAQYDQALSLFYEGEYAKSQQLLMPFKAPSPEWQQKKKILESLLVLNQNKGIPPTFRTNDPEWMPYLLYIKALGLLYLGDINNVYIIMEQLRELPNVMVILVHRLQIAMVEYHIENRQYEMAKSHLFKLRQSKKSTHIEKDIYLLLIKVYMRQRNRSQIMKIYGEMVRDFPEFDKDGQVLETINFKFRKKINFYDCIQSEKDMLILIRNLFRLEYYFSFKQTATIFNDRYPLSNNKIEVDFYEAMIDFYQMKHSQAYQKFKVIMGNLPPKYYKDKIKYYMARCKDLLEHDEEAEKRYQAIINQYRYPVSLRYRAYYYLSHLYLNLDMQEELMPLKKTFERKARRSSWYQQYQWEEQLEPIREMNQASSVMALLGSLVPNQELREQMVVHWKQMGAQYQVKGNDPLLKGLQLLPLNYDVQWVLSGWADDTSERRQESRVQDWLYDVGLKSLILEFVDADIERKPYRSTDDYLNQLSSYQNFSSTYETLKKAKKLAHQLNQDQIPITKELSYILYPKTYWKTVEKYAKLYRVDPYLIMALIREQSQFVPDLVKGDHLGLLQIKPSVGKDIAFALGDFFGESTKLLDPKVSIRYTCYFIKDLLTTFDQNLFLSLIAFKKELDVASVLGKARPFGTFEESHSSTPYLPLRSWISDVMNSYMIYQIIYEGNKDVPPKASEPKKKKEKGPSVLVMATP